MESKRFCSYCLEKNKFYGFFVRSCGDFLLIPPDRESQRQKVDFGEIFWPISGQAKFCMTNRQYTLKPGMLWYYPPQSTQNYYPIRDFHYCWLTIGGEYAGALFSGFGLKPGINSCGECPTEQFSSIIFQLQHYSLENHKKTLLDAIFILSEISNLSKKQNLPISLAKSAEKILSSNYSDPILDISSIAELLNVHRGSLSRAFRREFGVSISERLRSKRLYHAMLLLSDSAFSISEIARQSGFASSQYFIHVFVNQMGMSPSDFRKKHRKYSNGKT